MTTISNSSVFLAPGEHDLELLASNVENGFGDGIFDISIYYRGNDGVTRIMDDQLLYQAVPEPGSALILMATMLLTVRGTRKKEATPRTRH